MSGCFQKPEMLRHETGVAGADKTGILCGKRQKVLVPEHVGGTQTVAGLGACGGWKGTSGGHATKLARDRSVADAKRDPFRIW
jgi:hypothetical protein